ncbi:MAG: ABC transporter permease, partial [Caldilineaceae bacterium]
VLPAGFAEALLSDPGAQIEVIVDPARRQSAGIVTGQVQAASAPLLIDAEVTRGIARAFSGDLSVGGNTINLEGTGLLSADVERFLTAALQGVVSSQVQDALENPLVRTVTASVGNPAERTTPPTIMDALVPGYAFFFGFFIVGMLGEQALADRSQGTWRRLRGLPASRWSLLVGRAAPYFTLSTAQILLVMGVSVLLFEFDLGDSTAAYLLMVVASAAAIAGVATFVSVFARTEGQAGALPDLINLGMAAVSGLMFPSIRIPLLAYFTPHYWAARGFQEVTAANLGPSDILLEAGILLAIAVAFFSASALRFRRE